MPVPAHRVVIRGVVGHDPGDQRLEAGVPTELGGVQLSMRHHHPPQIARLPQTPDHHLRLCAVTVASSLHTRRY